MINVMHKHNKIYEFLCIKCLPNEILMMITQTKSYKKNFIEFILQKRIDYFNIYELIISFKTNEKKIQKIREKKITIFN